MICFYCGNEVDEHTHACPYCNANLEVYRKIMRTAEAFYNDGLERAKVRDISGAIRSLKECLRYNKNHTDARNLLGLCYFEIGDLVSALAEWVISKNLQFEDNRADEYLNVLQNTSGMLDKMNKTIRKYNQALEYCRAGSRDLARIQLRRVLGMNSKLVEGHQLLALICIQDGEYEEARKELSAANKIDVKNTVTLRYMAEVKEALRAQNANKKKKRKENVIKFQDGNDSVMMPNTSFRDFLDNSRASVVNILVGLVIGLLICFFLIIPTIRQNANNNAANSLVDANNEVANSSNSIATLQSQVEDLQSQLEKYTGQDDAKTSYENLIAANNSYTEKDLEAAKQSLSTINRDLLDTNGQALYDTINAAVNEESLSSAYNTAYSAYQSGDYQTAIDTFKTITDVNESYHDGNPVYYIAQSYRFLNDSENAITYYNKYLELFPNGDHASNCKKQIKDLGGTVGSEDTSETQTTEQ
ncbi:MAG: tetratricopeptide repeat protein [Lachnospiraceae bacterium]|nr:tetratricopeptide repeat protein [Lachnospiraceae bacterium]